MFGDWGWNSERTTNQESNMERFLAQITRDIALVVIEIGIYPHKR